jgi:thiol-disulfide isomerase/thioredoxin/uncharacterized membrane protein YphA (DoxX/SURF4 family)
MVFLQVALGVVLAVAGLGKLRDLSGSRQAVTNFGIPERYSYALGTALPIAELILAALLLPSSTARWAGLAAGLLFFVFIVAIGYNLSQGKQPDCHCFGQIHSEPAGWSTIVRNAVLLLAAATIVWNGGHSPTEWLRDLSDLATVGLIVTLAILAVGLLQAWQLRQMQLQQSRMIDRLDSIILNSVTPSASHADTVTTEPFLAPSFDLPDLAGGRMSLPDLLEGRKPVLLVFADPNCGPCNALLPDVGEWSHRFSDELVVAIISSGAEEANRRKAVEHAIPHVAIQEEREVQEAYGVRGTPCGVLIDPVGIIVEPLANGRDEIRDLVARTVSKQQAFAHRVQAANDRGATIDPDNLSAFFHPVEGLTLGAPVTRLPLPDLDGNYVGLDDFLGDTTIVVFWSASCGFCQRMLPDFKEWEADAGPMVSRVLLVSDGSVGDNLAMNVQSCIVLDIGFTMGTAFGATGTPSAILLDKDGRVASKLIVGADAVLDLLYDQTESSKEQQVPNDS